MKWSYVCYEFYLSNKFSIHIPSSLLLSIKTPCAQEIYMLSITKQLTAVNLISNEWSFNT